MTTDPLTPETLERLSTLRHQAACTSDPRDNINETELYEIIQALPALLAAARLGLAAQAAKPVEINSRMVEVALLTYLTTCKGPEETMRAALQAALAARGGAV